MGNNSEKDSRLEPTPEIQLEFDNLWLKVLIACDEVIFNTPEGEARYIEIMGGEENIKRYKTLRNEFKVKLKKGVELGYQSRLNG